MICIEKILKALALIFLLNTPSCLELCSSQILLNRECSKKASLRSGVRDK